MSSYSGRFTDGEKIALRIVYIKKNNHKATLFPKRTTLSPIQEFPGHLIFLKLRSAIAKQHKGKPQRHKSGFKQASIGRGRAKYNLTT
jgi:hypothetical protein